MDYRKWLVILLAVLLAVFVSMNLAQAEIAFFGMRAQMPIALVVLVSSALGFGLGWLLAYLKKRRKPAA